MSSAGKNFVFLGPPGAGKGTQAALMAERHSLAHVSTGNLLRQHVKDQTPIGLIAKGMMERGVLVGDDIVSQILRERLDEDDAGNGFILDGFPRTLAQAEMLDGDLVRLNRPLSKVINFDVTESALLERLTGRLTCKNCGAIFHKSFNPPAKAGVCDACGQEALYTRGDDTEEAVTKRLVEYREKTAPLLDYYTSRDLMVTVDAAQTVSDVERALEKALEPR